MSAKKTDTKKLNPQTVQFEFFGPIGAFGVISGCTLVVFGWYFGCNRQNGCDLPVTGEQWKNIADGFSSVLSWPSSAFDLTVMAYYTAWWLWFAFLWYIVPGQVAKGTKLRTGEHLNYRLNGLGSFIVTAVVGVAVFCGYGRGPFIWVADHFLQLVMASWIFATVQALLVYLYSFRSETVMLALGGNSGNIVYDFFIGRELNPRLFGWVNGFDIKHFNEQRPGLIGWVMLNVCFAIKQYDQLGYVTNSMWLAIVPQIIYVIDTFYFESAVLTTMDITTDGFGWMLSFGDLCWVPSMYSLQARFLSFHPISHSPLYTALVTVLSVVSFLTFRLSNSEKNAFRTDPNQPSVQHLKYIKTESGSKLLVSGWWGMARHINYTGDWFFGLSQCLATGFDTPMTYFFAAYFLVLLLHRNSRDEHKCRQKYKKDWDVYCQKVPYLFIPYLI